METLVAPGWRLFTELSFVLYIFRGKFKIYVLRFIELMRAPCTWLECHHRYGPASMTDERLVMEEGWLMDWLSGDSGGGKSGKN